MPIGIKLFKVGLKFSFYWVLVSIFVLKHNKIDNLIIYFSIFLSLLPICISIGSKPNANLLLICSYSIYSFFSDVFLSRFFQLHFGSEIFSYRLFTIIEFLIFISLIYINSTSRKIKNIALFSILIFFLSLIIDLGSFNIYDFDSLPTGVESIIIITLTLFCIREKLLSERILTQIDIWIHFSNLIYFSGLFFLFILSQKNIHNPEFANIFAMGTAIFNIIKNLIYSVGIFIHKYSTKYSQFVNNLI